MLFRIEHVVQAVIPKYVFPNDFYIFIIIQLLTIEILDMTQYRPKNTSIDQGNSQG